MDSEGLCYACKADSEVYMFCRAHANYFYVKNKIGHITTQELKKCIREYEEKYGQISRIGGPKLF
jgi:hypothetical protein